MGDVGALNVFISFAEQDQDLLEKMQTHLATLIRGKKIRVWHRGMLPSGGDVAQAGDRLAAADIVLLLVTPSLVASHWETEIQPAMDRRVAEEVLVIPILLKPVEWRGTPFEMLQPLPDNRKPVTLWSDKDEAFLNVTQGISRAVDGELRRREERRRADEQEFLNELASVFGTEGAVHNLLTDADVPREQVKPFGQDTPLRYWTAVCDELESGLTEHGLRGLVEAALRQYTYNKVFQGALERLSSSGASAPPDEYPAVSEVRQKDSGRGGEKVTGGGPLRVADIRGRVDVGILTIRPDEFKAVLRRFSGRATVGGGKNFYEYARVDNDAGSSTRVAAARILEAGQGKAQAVARDMIEDVSPAWIFLVGIAGGTPDDEYSLGDVVLAKRLHDYSVTAVSQSGTEYSAAGGPMHQDVERLLAHLPAWDDRLGRWSSSESVGFPKPPVDLEDDALFYGSAAWKKKVRQSLEQNFPPGRQPRDPVYWEGATADGNVLVKNASLLESWMKTARDIRLVEMELGGVYQAARHGGHQECRVLAIRALSDIVGYKRHADWTQYACHSAAAFAHALIRAGVIHQVAYP